jgi:hypothetical protein
MSESRTKTARAQLAELVGVDQDADKATVNRAALEVLDELDELKKTPHPQGAQTARPVDASPVIDTPTAFQPPAGTMLVDEGVFASLRDQASRFDNLRAELAQRVGCDDTADLKVVLAAVDEALAEAADMAPTEGVEMVNAAELAELRTDAQLQRTAVERNVVENAIRDGRIPSRDRGHWVNLLTVSPSAAETLQGLPKGLIPVDGPRGYTGGLEAVREGSEDLLDKLFGED